MNLDEERKSFDKWHFLDWKLNCAVTDTIEEAKIIYDRIYKPTNYDQIYVREQSFKAWLAAKAHESEKLKGCVVVSSEDIEKITDYLALAGCHPSNSADDENDIYGLMEKLEEARGGND